MATVTGGGGGAWMVTGATASFLVGDLAVLEDGEVASMAKSARAGPAVCFEVDPYGDELKYET